MCPPGRAKVAGGGVHMLPECSYKVEQSQTFLPVLRTRRTSLAGRQHTAGRFVETWMGRILCFIKT